MGNKYSVLFVDDELNILASLKRGLMDEEYSCFFASGGAKALEILKTENICVIVTDMRMPGIDGLSLLKEVKAQYPAVVRIVLSGYTQLQQVLTTINQVDVFKFITKPWNLEAEFKIVIKQAIEFYRIQEERNELEAALNKKNVAYQNILKDMGGALDAAKRSAEGVQQLGKAAFNHLLAPVRDNSDATVMADQLERANRLFEMLAPMYSKESKNISISELCNEIADYVKTLPGNISGKTVIRVPAEVKCFVNKTLKLLFTSLFEMIFELNGQCNIKMMFEGITANQSELLLECSAIISRLEKTTQSAKEGDACIVGRNMELISSMFGALVAFIGGNLAFGKSDDDIFLKLALKLKLS